jgi:hypothetical protein
MDVLTKFFVKVGSFPIPIPPAGVTINGIYFSQTFLDNDSGWEIVANFVDTLNWKQSFKVLDETGKVLVSDTGRAFYTSDGQNTYIISTVVADYSYKLWKFRSNIFSSSQPLAKSSSSAPGPLMTYMPSGDLRVHLQSAAGGASIQIFDMLGRQIFSETIRNITKPSTFTIPSSGMPNSPFVARVNSTNGSCVRKGMPVR